MNEGTGSGSTTGGFLKMLDFGFNRFITLQAIKFVYVLGLILLVLSWLVFSIGAMSELLCGAGPVAPGHPRCGDLRGHAPHLARAHRGDLPHRREHDAVGADG